MNTSSQKVGGRPTGKTQAYIDNIQECIISAQHEITEFYKEVIIDSKAKGEGRLPKGLYAKIHDSKKLKQNLPEHFKFSYETANKCISRNISLLKVGDCYYTVLVIYCCTLLQFILSFLI